TWVRSGQRGESGCFWKTKAYRRLRAGEAGLDRSSEGSPNSQKLVPALAADRLAIEPGELMECARDRFSGCRNGRGGIAMRAARGLGYDPIDDPEAHHILCGNLHSCRRVFRLAGVAPENGCGTFR